MWCAMYEAWCEIFRIARSTGAAACTIGTWSAHGITSMTCRNASNIVAGTTPRRICGSRGLRHKEGPPLLPAGDLRSFCGSGLRDRHSGVSRFPSNSELIGNCSALCRKLVGITWAATMVCARDGSRRQRGGYELDERGHSDGLALHYGVTHRAGNISRVTR